MKTQRKIKTVSITLLVFTLIYTDALVKTIQKQNYYGIQSSLVFQYNPTKLLTIENSNNYKKCKKETSNFMARYKYGNKQEKGIKNMHINIRSIRNKMQEIKYIVQSHSPHILGVSETEIENNNFDVDKLKVPGYDLILPKSWNNGDKTRVVVYVKKSFQYEHLDMLESNSIQSIWIRGHFKNSKNIYFCHAYREHMT